MPCLLLVEDDRHLREALSAALTTRGYEVSAFPAAVPAMFALDAGLRVELALLDLGLPDRSGIDVVRALRRQCPEATALVFTVQDDAPTVIEALRAGARGYLLKSTRLERLVEALDEARGGGVPMSAQVARYLVAQLPAEEDGRRLDALTARERDVLRLLARGHAYAEVATALGIALGTVQMHVRNLYAKLEVSSKAEAAAVATRLGWR
ncbi:MAG: response regulator transcription factor [Archangium sp.]|nr:response regulator transcription factor [Archangium sp.]